MSIYTFQVQGSASCCCHDLLCLLDHFAIETIIVVSSGARYHCLLRRSLGSVRRSGIALIVAKDMLNLFLDVLHRFLHCRRSSLVRPAFMRIATERMLHFFLDLFHHAWFVRRLILIRSSHGDFLFRYYYLLAKEEWVVVCVALTFIVRMNSSNIYPLNEWIEFATSQSRLRRWSWNPIGFSSFSIISIRNCRIGTLGSARFLFFGRSAERGTKLKPWSAIESVDDDNNLFDFDAMIKIECHLLRASTLLFDHYLLLLASFKECN